MKARVYNIIQKLFFIVLVIGFVILSTAAKIKKEQNVVKGVEVKVDRSKGHFFVDEEYIIKTFEEQLPRKGERITNKSLTGLKKRIVQNAFLKDAFIYKNRHNDVAIYIEQRTPICRVLDVTGKSYYIDQEMNKFPLSTSYTPKVPLITGYVPDNGLMEGIVQEERMKKIISNIVEIRKDDFWTSMISQYYIGPNGKLEFITRLGNYRVSFDENGNINDQLRRLEIFFYEIAQNKGWNKYKKVDIKFNNQIVCSK